MRPAITTFEQLMRRVESRLERERRHTHAPSQEVMARLAALEQELAAERAFTPFTAYAPSLSGFTANSSCGWQKRGRLVIWRFSFTRNVGSGSIAGSFALGTVPATARPIEQGIFALLYNSGPSLTPRRLQFDVSGLLNVASGSSISEGNSVTGSVAFIGPE